MSALAKKAAKPIEQSRAEIFAMLDASSRGGLVWEQLQQSERRIFCFAAGLKQSHIDKPISKFNELERHKLLRAIKSIEQAAKKFTTVSIKDFK